MITANDDLQMITNHKRRSSKVYMQLNNLSVACAKTHPKQEKS